MHPESVKEPGMQDEELYTIDELAARLKVKPSTVRGWRRDGKGPRAVMVGGAVRYRPEAVKEWLDSLEERRGAGA